MNQKIFIAFFLPFSLVYYYAVCQNIDQVIGIASVHV